MAEKKETVLLPARTARDPFAVLRHLTSEFDRVFEPFTFRWPYVRSGSADTAGWWPKVDVYERDNRLVTRVDLPGVKREAINVEVIEGHLVISGERKYETEEKTDRNYRTEREYGTFCRAVALPEGVKLEEVKATFSEGVLEVSVPIPSRAEARPRKVEIEAPERNAKTAA
jgi:HSP20 family protein